MINSCVFVGRVSTEIEIRKTNNCVSCCNFQLAVQRKFTDKTDFPPMAAYGKLAEIIQQYVKKTVLLKTQYDDNSFSLPKIELSEQDRDLLERIVTGEFGNSFVGSCLIAQAIKCAIVYDHYTSIADLIIGMGYVGDTNQKSQNAVEAAKFIFDENGLAVKHRLFYMCTEDYYNSDPGNFHSTQNFILQYENVKFFDRW